MEINNRGYSSIPDLMEKWGINDNMKLSEMYFNKTAEYMKNHNIEPTFENFKKRYQETPDTELNKAIIEDIVGILTNEFTEADLNYIQPQLAKIYKKISYLNHHKNINSVLLYSIKEIEKEISEISNLKNMKGGKRTKKRKNKKQRKTRRRQ